MLGDVLREPRFLNDPMVRWWSNGAAMVVDDKFKKLADHDYYNYSNAVSPGFIAWWAITRVPATVMCRFRMLLKLEGPKKVNKDLSKCIGSSFSCQFLCQMRPPWTGSDANERVSTAVHQHYHGSPAWRSSTGFLSGNNCHDWWCKHRSLTIIHLKSLMIHTWVIDDHQLKISAPTITRIID